MADKVTVSTSRTTTKAAERIRGLSHIKDAATAQTMIKDVYGFAVTEDFAKFFVGIIHDANKLAGPAENDE